MGKAIRKPHPSPPRWFFWDNDNCWFCKNRRNCGNCSLCKELNKEQQERRNRKEKQNLKNLRADS